MKNVDDLINQFEVAPQDGASDIDSLIASLPEVKEKTSFGEDVRHGLSRLGSNFNETLVNVVAKAQGYGDAGTSIRQAVKRANKGVDTAVGFDPQSYAQKEPGFGGKLTTGATMVAPSFLAGLVSMPLALTIAGVNAYGQGKGLESNLLEQGVDPATATKVKQIEWLSSGMDYAFPAFGRAANVGQAMVKSGLQGGANVGQNFLTDIIQRKTLEGAGYDKQAKTFDPYDYEQRAVEFILGAGPSFAIRAKGLADAKTADRAAKDKIAKLAQQNPEQKLSIEVNGTSADVGPGKPKILVPSEFVYKRSAQVKDGEPIPENLKPTFYEMDADSPIAKAYQKSLDKQQDVVDQQHLATKDAEGNKVTPRPDLVGQRELDLQPVRDQPAADPRDPNAFHFPKRDEQLDLFTPDNITRTVDQQIAALEDAGILRTRDTMNERIAEADAQASGMFRGREDMDIPPQLDPTRPALTQAPARDVAAPQTVPDAALLRSQGGPLLPTPPGRDVLGRTSQTPEQQRPALLGPISNRTRRGRQRGAILNPKDLYDEYVAKLKGKSNQQSATPTQIAEVADLGRIDTFKNNIKAFMPIEDVATAKTEALASPDSNLNAIGKWAGAGPRYAAAVTKNPILRWLNNRMNRADDMKRNWITKNVLPFAEVYSKMSKQEKIDANAALTYGDQVQRYLTPEEMRNAGFSDPVIDFVQRYYAADKAKLVAENAARAKAGLPLIEERPGHLPGRWRGDFTQLVYRTGEKGTEIVAVLQTDSLAEARAAKREIAKTFPGEKLEFSQLKKRKAGGFNRSAGDLAAGMQEIVRILGNDPRFAKVREAIAAMGNQDAMSMYGADKHALFKKGVLGNEGNKIWKSAEYNAEERFFSIIRYFEEGATSLSRREPYSEIKSLIADPDLQMKQPNTLKYLQDYYNQQNDLNANPIGHFTSYLFEAAPTLLGFGPSTAHKVANRVTNLYQTLTLSSVRFMLVQLMQPLQTGLPMLQHIANRTDLPFGTAEKYFMKGYQDMVTSQFEYMFQRKFPHVDDFTRSMYDYAEERGITSFSGLDRATEAGKSPARKRGELAAVFPQESSERATRPHIFYALARTAKEAGFSTKDALNVAYEATQMAMVDYRDTQAPMMYQKMGALGDQAIRLRKFSHGLGSQMSYYGQNDKVALTTLGVSTFLMAGLRGIIPMTAVAWLYNEMTGEDFEEKVMDNLGDWAEYGALSSMSGQWLQPTFSLTGLFPDFDNAVSDVMPYGGMAVNTAEAGVNMVKNPSYDTMATFLASLTPAQFRNLMQKNMFKDEQGNLLDRKREFVSYRRNPEDWEGLAFSLGFTSYEEGKNKARQWENTKKEMNREKDIQSLGKDIRTMVRSRQFTKDDLQSALSEYAELNPFGFESFVNSLRNEPYKKALTRQEFDIVVNSGPAAIAKYNRLSKGVKRERRETGN